MPAPITPADKAAFAADWQATKATFNKVQNLGRGVSEVRAFSNVVAAVDAALSSWRMGRMSDADFTRLVKAIGPASIAVGDATRRLQSYGLADAINEFQAQVDGLNGYLIDYLDADQKVPVALIALGVVGVLAFGLVISSRR